MDNIKDDNYYLDRLKYHFDRINTVMKKVSYKSFANNEDA